MSPFIILTGLYQGSTPWYLVLLIALAPLSLVMAVGADRSIGKQVTSRLLAGLDERKPTGDRDYVLYLRSFFVDADLSRTDKAGGSNFLTSLVGYFGYRDPDGRDSTWESRLTHLFQCFGRVVAVGRPAEPLPPLGARRFYMPPAGQGWKKEVAKAISGARLVVIVAAIGQDAGRAEGTLWEYSEAVRVLPPSRVLLVACGEREDYERFRAGAAEYFRERAAELRMAGEELPPAPVLPNWVEPQRPSKLRRGFPLRGVVRFDTGWATEFVPFDPTAERGLTPYARWRRTVHTQVEPWMDECEDRLPGQAVYPGTHHWHWHLKVFGALVLGWLATYCAQHWGRLLLPQKLGLCVDVVFALAALARLADMARNMSRSDVEVSDEEESEEGADRPPSSSETPSIPARTEYVVTKFVARWPGRFGIGLFVTRIYRDKDLRHVDPPARRPFWSVRTARMPLTPFRTERQWPGGFVLRGRALDVVQIERDSHMTSRQFGQRALLRLAGAVGTVVGTAVGVFRVRTGGQMLGASALGLLSAYWFWFRSRNDFNRMSRMRWRPRVPEDLAGEPCVLYLRPHPDDPVPPSPWQGPLDVDLHTVFVETALFRVGHVPQASPPTVLARLPLPADGRQATLTAALPHCGLVVIPVTGTSSATLWQLTEAVRLIPPSRLLLLLLPGEDAAEEYARFRQAAAEAFAERAASLPEAARADFRPLCLPLELPDAAPPGQREPALRAAIHFAEDWTPAVLRFSPVDTASGEVPRRTQLLRIRAELQPILAGLSPAQEQPVG
ncbi:hypothetical protein [Streptomyces sp. NPDC002889]|uniref:hypothetical protein n=1 Tax=Streptomyces sp. NPDC002889 TaxID=3364669 RepID=UPI0036ADCA96